MNFTCFALLTFLVVFNKVLHEAEGQQGDSRQRASKGQQATAPNPLTYRRMREFWECVSCNSNNRARTDFDSCLSKLSLQTKRVLIACCRSTYGSEFCQEVAVGKTNYGKICKNPRNGISVERCFWKERNKNQADVAKFKTCKRAILSKYCTGG